MLNTDHPDRLSLLGAVAAAWSLRLVLFPSVTDTAISIGGMLSLCLLVYVILRLGMPPAVQWNGESKLAAVFRPWSVEICATCVIASVPIGIDLKHAAGRVLAAMSTRLEEEEGGELRFFLARPLGNRPTKVGMMVARRASRIIQSKSRVLRMTEKVAEDAQVLEGAMRAAYPHTPVHRGGLKDALIVLNGGIEVNVECHQSD
ncbi:MAG: hypothetical protein JSW61_00465 [Candidatus Thorarchaeota archaeon]|nr:MAG: hypothetical protein JSW61_00465 [Candidatus Thorarchaeota archaeon]